MFTDQNKSASQSHQLLLLPLILAAAAATTTTTVVVVRPLLLLLSKSRVASRTLFSNENLVSTAREFSRKCETLRCESSTLAIISLNYGKSMHNLSTLTH